MKKYSGTILVIILLFTKTEVSAQIIVCDSLHWAKPGTYEVTIIPGTVEGAITPTSSLPSYILCEIELLRKKYVTVEYKLNYCTLIKIYPSDLNIETNIE